MTRTEKPEVLIVCKDFRYQGGVVNYIETLFSRFSDERNYHHFSLGRPPGKNKALPGFLDPVIDSIRLIREVRKRRVDLVHLNPSLNVRALLRDGLYMLVLSGFTRAKTLVFFHGWDDQLAATIKERRLYSLLFRSVFGHASQFLVLAQRFKDSLVQMGLDSNDIDVVTTMFDGQLLKGVTRQSTSVRPTLLFMSRFVAEKGIYELLSAFLNLGNRYPDAHLVLAGDGPEMNAMEAWVKNHNLDSSVTFPGYLRDKDKAQALVDADLFVFPTYYGEGCPVALLEAMAAGLPVVTGAAGGIADFFQDGENGVLLPEVTPKSVEDAICMLLEDPQLSSRIALKNRQQAEDNYEAAVITREIEQLYEIVLSEAT